MGMTRDAPVHQRTCGGRGGAAKTAGQGHSERQRRWQRASIQTEEQAAVGDEHCQKCGEVVAAAVDMASVAFAVAVVAAVVRAVVGESAAFDEASHLSYSVRSRASWPTQPRVGMETGLPVRAHERRRTVVEVGGDPCFVIPRGWGGTGSYETGLPGHFR